ncbi:MAG TPA: tRNA (adenosine(37)-N6)-threonylcarbamoyltransferase complex transferase subunit TsaD [Patescibacteria group bacterium]|nr:tRNA (adenosine(37)-N6)-threonylcarbamoyltransferase complex transferase subunit TsaD [Patescibacteria group bacterium]
MVILGIETSCDETSAAIVAKSNETLILKSHVVATSLAIHSKTGGIIPENAAREQIKYLLPVIKQSLEDAKITLENVDAIAVTYGPGLIGSLLVGVETAKTIALVQDKPIIPVNHMVGHIYANWLRAESKEHGDELYALRPMPYAIQFPALALVVSGGHTDLLLMKRHGDFTLLGGTRDDAAGEAFDKIGRLLGFAYPAGSLIEQKAKLGNPKRFLFPRPLIGSGDYDFSFSGLKTAVLREVIKLNKNKSLIPNTYTLNSKDINDICAGVQHAITDVLVKKTLKAVQEYKVKSLLLSGGVAANQTLRDEFQVSSSKFQVKFFAPAKNLCTDNGAMIAAAAAYNYHPVPWKEITADPELYFD